MNYKFWILVAALWATATSPTMAWADEVDPLTQEETAASETENRPEWKSSVQTKYNLTDEQMKQMTDAGVKGPGLAITAGLAQASGKTVQEIALMRTEQKMGWGKIAKDLGVHPSEIGKSVSSLNRNIREGRAEARDEKLAKKQAKREERLAKKEEKKAEKMEKREAKRAEKAAKKQ